MILIFQIKEDSVDGTCSMHEEMRSAYSMLFGNMKGRRHLGDIDGMEKILLK